MDTLLRTVFNHFLTAFCEPLEDEGIQLSFQDGIIVKDIIVRPEAINKELAKAEADMRIDWGKIGFMRICYTTVPGVVTMQMNAIDLRVRPNALRTLGRVMKKAIADAFSPPDLEDEGIEVPPEPMPYGHMVGLSVPHSGCPHHHPCEYVYPGYIPPAPMYHDPSTCPYHSNVSIPGTDGSLVRHLYFCPHCAMPPANPYSVYHVVPPHEQYMPPRGDAKPGGPMHTSHVHTSQPSISRPTCPHGFPTGECLGPHHSHCYQTQLVPTTHSHACQPMAPASISPRRQILADTSQLPAHVRQKPVAEAQCVLQSTPAVFPPLSQRRFSHQRFHSATNPRSDFTSEVSAPGSEHRSPKRHHHRLHSSHHYHHRRETPSSCSHSQSRETPVPSSVCSDLPPGGKGGRDRLLRSEIHHSTPVREPTRIISGPLVRIPPTVMRLPAQMPVRYYESIPKGTQVDHGPIGGDLNRIVNAIPTSALNIGNVAIPTSNSPWNAAPRGNLASPDGNGETLPAQATVISLNQASSGVWQSSSAIRQHDSATNSSSTSVATGLFGTQSPGSSSSPTCRTSIRNDQRIQLENRSLLNPPGLGSTTKSNGLTSMGAA